MGSPSLKTVPKNEFLLSEEENKDDLVDFLERVYQSGDASANKDEAHSRAMDYLIRQKEHWCCQNQQVIRWMIHSLESVEEQPFITHFWDELSTQLRKCTTCISSYHLALEEAMSYAKIDLEHSGFVERMKSLDLQRVCKDLDFVQTRPPNTLGDPESIESTILFHSLYEALNYPSYMENSSFRSLFNHWIIRANIDTNGKKWCGIYCCLMNLEPGVRKWSQEITKLLGEITEADIESFLGVYLEEWMHILERRYFGKPLSELRQTKTPALSEDKFKDLDSIPTTSPVDQLFSLTSSVVDVLTPNPLVFWSGINKLTELMDENALDVVVQRFPDFPDLVYEYMTDSNMEVQYVLQAAKCYRRVLTVLSHRLWLMRTGFDYQFILQGLISSCRRDSTSPSCIIQVFLQLLEPLSTSLKLFNVATEDSVRDTIIRFLLIEAQEKQHFSDEICRVLATQVACRILQAVYGGAEEYHRDLAGVAISWPVQSIQSWMNCLIEIACGRRGYEKYGSIQKEALKTACIILRRHAELFETSCVGLLLLHSSKTSTCTSTDSPLPRTDSPLPPFRVVACLLEHVCVKVEIFDIPLMMHATIFYCSALLSTLIISKDGMPMLRVYRGEIDRLREILKIYLQRMLELIRSGKCQNLLDMPNIRKYLFPLLIAPSPENSLKELVLHFGKSTSFVVSLSATYGLYVADAMYSICFGLDLLLRQGFMNCYSLWSNLFFLLFKLYTTNSPANHSTTISTNLFVFEKNKHTTTICFRSHCFKDLVDMDPAATLDPNGEPIFLPNSLDWYLWRMIVYILQCDMETLKKQKLPHFELTMTRFYDFLQVYLKQGSKVIFLYHDQWCLLLLRFVNHPLDSIQRRAFLCFLIAIESISFFQEPIDFQVVLYCHNMISSNGDGVLEISQKNELVEQFQKWFKIDLHLDEYSLEKQTNIKHSSTKGSKIPKFKNKKKVVSNLKSFSEYLSEKNKMDKDIVGEEPAAPNDLDRAVQQVEAMMGDVEVEQYKEKSTNDSLEPVILLREHVRPQPRTLISEAPRDTYLSARVMEKVKYASSPLMIDLDPFYRCIVSWKLDDILDANPKKLETPLLCFSPESMYEKVLEPLLMEECRAIILQGYEQSDKGSWTKVPLVSIRSSKGFFALTFELTPKERYSNETRNRYIANNLLLFRSAIEEGKEPFFGIIEMEKDKKKDKIEDRKKVFVSVLACAALGIDLEEGSTWMVSTICNLTTISREYEALKSIGNLPPHIKSSYLCSKSYLQRVLGLKEKIMETNNEDTENLIQILEELNHLHVNLKCLTLSKIGKVVGKLRKHPNGLIQTKSKLLVEKWKGTLDLSLSKNQEPPKPNNVSEALWHKLRQQYNPSQLAAIASSCQIRTDLQEDDGFPCSQWVKLLQGPPGTGKTRVICGIINAVLSSTTTVISNTEIGKSRNTTSGTVVSKEDLPITSARNRGVLPTTSSFPSKSKIQEYARKQEQDAQKNLKGGAARRSSMMHHKCRMLSSSVAIKARLNAKMLGKSLPTPSVPMASSRFSRVSSTSISKRQRKNVLICAPSNGAVDEVCSRLLNTTFYDNLGNTFKPKLVRLGYLNDDADEQLRNISLPCMVDQKLNLHPVMQQKQQVMKRISTLKEDLDKVAESMNVASSNEAKGPLYVRRKKLSQELSGCYSNLRLIKQQLEAIRRKIEIALVEDSPIVCCTLSCCGSGILERMQFGFDVLVIDEACQAIELSTLIPLRHRCGRVILVGDRQQLPATVISTVALSHSYDRSLFERLEDNGYDVLMLDTQYRMHPSISLFPAYHFYQNRLCNGSSVGCKERLNQAYYKHACFQPYVFYDLTMGQDAMHFNNSYKNELEANFAYDICVKLHDLYQPGEIGIITPYKGQVVAISNRLWNFKNVEVNTVDGFQGQEKDMIIFSCVRGNKKAKLGFLRDIRRMNVGLTRAKYCLLVLGNRATLKGNEDWSALISNAEERNCIIEVGNESFDDLYYRMRNQPVKDQSSFIIEETQSITPASAASSASSASAATPHQFLKEHSSIQEIKVETISDGIRESLPETPRNAQDIKKRVRSVVDSSRMDSDKKLKTTPLNTTLSSRVNASVSSNMSASSSSSRTQTSDEMLQRLNTIAEKREISHKIALQQPKPVNKSLIRRKIRPLKTEDARTFVSQKKTTPTSTASSSVAISDILQGVSQIRRSSAIAKTSLSLRLENQQKAPSSISTKASPLSARGNGPISQQNHRLRRSK